MKESTAEEDRRKYPRLNAPIYYRSAQFFSRRTPVVNISLGGIRVYSDEGLKIGKRLELELFLPDKTSIVCTARVVWQKPLPEGAVAKYEVGIEFLEINPDVVERLSKVLEFQPPAE